MHWRLLLALAVPLAACPPAATPVAPESTPEPARRATPTGPRVLPSVGYDPQELTLSFEGLPAVSADGQHVALAVVLEDGARGAANGALRVIEVDTGRVTEQILMRPDEGDALDDEGQRQHLRSRLPDRVAAARDMLAGRIWHALDGLEAGPPDEDLPGATSRLTFGDLTITFREPRLTLTRGGRELVARDFPEWSTPRTLRYPDCDAAGDPTCVCANPAFPAAAWIDLPTGVVLLRIAYVGDDTCWEPEARLHVLRLPR